ncbi:biotin/lipoyl-containing protein [Nioella sp.]|uniref:biotin/lipoyl-containing protein n=1 Tax=Nioella sp. TaxID=1912091 RepID=UPI003B51DEF5
MPHEVIMPALGMAQDTGKIVSWLKQAGDVVKAGDALFEVETDKATMEVESPADGFLTDVTAGDGDDVPVGNVIALISDTAEGSGTAAPAPAADAPASDDLSEGTGVIMPALGMAQDEGVIVAWHKAPGDAVASGDILFEVETDKATMEVEAGHDGFVAALLAEAGEAAPVGEVIAIISAEAPANPVSRSWSGGAQPTPAPVNEQAKPAPAPKPAAEPVAKAAAPVATGGRILASPKARKIALEEGLDLQRLVAVGHPQPYHVADLEVLRSLPDATAEPTPTTAAAASRHLTAEVPAKAFADFCAWATEDIGAPVDRAALLARFAAASIGDPLAAIAVDTHGQTRVMPEDAEPALTIRDLAGTPITSVNLGAEATPVLTLTDMGDTLTITLECAPGQLSTPQALSLIGGFAGRLAEPLRHLL